jgi:hypothetical protein
MRIERFHIQGFKSIADVEVEGLSDINVFYGLNDVGKSNIFQALALWRWLLAASSTSSQFEIALDPLEADFGFPLFWLKGDNTIYLEVEFVPDKLDLAEQSALAEAKEVLSQLDSSDMVRIVSEVEMGLDPKMTQQVVWCRTMSRGYTRAQQFDMAQVWLSLLLPGFHIIQATRRFQVEQKGKGNDLGPVGDHNLKQALFYAYLSPDPHQKRRLAAIRRILAGPPFSLGELDVALDPATDRIDIGFVRPEGRLPLENLGSGSQQLLMVLGQIFLNDYPIIAIEEPEMNLSPQYQQHLLVALRKLMQDPDVKLSQLFISTHSPYFEFEESFFDVTLDERGTTQVTWLPIEKRDRYFPDTRVGPEMGSRLNSLNQITLYDGVILWKSHYLSCFLSTSKMPMNINQLQNWLEQQNQRPTL